MSLPPRKLIIKRRSSTLSSSSTVGASITSYSGEPGNVSLECVTDGSLAHKSAADECEHAIDCLMDSLPQSLEGSAHDSLQNDIALFRPDEIDLGLKLGSGEFSNVYEVDAFHLHPEEIELPQIESEKRLHMKLIEKYHDTNMSRYALKHIKVQFLVENGEDAYIQAAVDLAQEAEYLSRLCHPNIIKLRGLSHSGVAGFEAGPCGYFLIIDQLTETLDQRIKRWHAPPEPIRRGRRSGVLRNSLKSLSSSFKSKGHTVSDFTEARPRDSAFIGECLEVALQISAALEYLHSNSIIFRDLKPDNIGFDVRGDVKIFDFGLARIMPKGGDHYNDMYHMSGAGSPRYMAPECLAEKDYNMKADVYTFAIVLWQMLAGRKPYGFIKSRSQLIHAVIAKGNRPHIEECWPDHIRGMIESSFEANPDKRPKMRLFYGVIKKALARSRGSNEGLSDSFILRRRSDASAHNMTKVLAVLKEEVTDVSTSTHDAATGNMVDVSRIEFLRPLVQERVS